MKASKYNFLYETDSKDNWVLYNSRTGALSVIESDYYDSLVNLEKQNIPISNDKHLKDLKACGYIIDDYVDELDLIRHRMNQYKYTTAQLSLTIAPTMQCNFGCIYCFEKNNSRNLNMTSEVSEKIISLVKTKAAELTYLHITWFGGEPLLDIDTLYSMSKEFIKICKENNIQYHSRVITNGYFLTEEVAKKLVECQIEMVQVTLDGPKDIHDSRRPLIGGQGTFDKVVKNVIQCADIVPIAIRINTDKENYSRIYEIIDILKKANVVDKIIPYLGLVEASNDGYENSKCMSVETYSKFNLDFLERNQLDIMNIYPEPKGSYCGADSMNNYVIDPKGYLYKCWSDIGILERSIGSIMDEQYKGNSKLCYEYLFFDATQDEKCKDCKYLPFCMGGCASSRIHNRENCVQQKYVLEEYLIECAKLILPKKLP